jgi:hypothetical protein
MTLSAFTSAASVLPRLEKRTSHPLSVQLPANTALAYETATTMGVEYAIPVDFTCYQNGQTVVAYAQLPVNTALPTDAKICVCSIA